MPHITLDDTTPGIRSLFQAYPETAKPLMSLAQTLLRGDSTLSEGERELIAAYVSSQNECTFCARSHGAAAKHLLGEGGDDVIEQVWRDYERAPISNKLKALLNIAGKARKGGQQVAALDAERARKEGATDKEIHDTVLIAAAFSMYNRYVDGLDTTTPDDEAVYDEMGAVLATEGYVREVGS